MSFRRIIPCLDCQAGRIVKGVRFQNLRDAGDPREAAARYAAEGADEIILLDVSATVEARGATLETVRAVREVLDIPLTVGGGVRASTDALALLQAGADKVAVNSAALARPALIEELAAHFGTQCVVLAIDAESHASGWRPRSHGGRNPIARDVVAWAKEGAARGAGEILLTSYDRDGTGLGFDTELIRQTAQAVRIPIIASGGADSADHCFEALAAGADAVLAASLFHDGRARVVDVRRALLRRGAEVRPC